MSPELKMSSIDPSAENSQVIRCGDQQRKNTDVRKEIVDTLTRVMKKEISSHTLPVFESNGKGGFKLRGSGVFVQLSDSYYILTASHVLDDKETLSLITVSGMIQIAGVCHISHENIADAGFIYLPDWLGELLCYNYVPINDWHISPNMQDFSTYPYIVYGYPAINFKKNKSGVLSGFGSGSMMMMSKPKVYNAFKRNPATNYIFDFWKAMRLDGLKAKLKSPNGMSGGGIWLVTYDKIGDRIRTYYTLVGIINEYQKKPFYVFIGTKIHQYMEEIIQEYNPEGWHMRKVAPI